MSILKPTTGELSDRLFLLALKVKKGKEKGVAVAHFEAEQKAVEEALFRRKRKVEGPAVLGLMARLRDAHEALWPLVERAEAGDPGVRACDTHALNRERRRAIEDIDKLTGEWQGPEKV